MEVQRLKSELESLKNSAHPAPKSELDSPHSIPEQEHGDLVPDSAHGDLCPADPPTECPLPPGLGVGLRGEDHTPQPECTTSEVGSESQVMGNVVQSDGT